MLLLRNLASLQSIIILKVFGVSIIVCNLLYYMMENYCRFVWNYKILLLQIKIEDMLREYLLEELKIFIKVRIIYWLKLENEPGLVYTRHPNESITNIDQNYHVDRPHDFRLANEICFDFCPNTKIEKHSIPSRSTA
jgi:hypothetical protein